MESNGLTKYKLEMAIKRIMSLSEIIYICFPGMNICTIKITGKFLGSIYNVETCYGHPIVSIYSEKGILSLQLIP